ncbi:MAG: hypothetical protein J7K72_02165 [Candidatus Aenigmarchaeota archaeon]|nr:hypothetical protein [Candidatus Aenigmarchaeota archaeon]
MGDVIVVFRIIPKEMDKFDSVREHLEQLKPQRLEEEPIAFGLKALRFTKLIPDKEGALTKLEEDIKNIDDVQTVETIEITRSL